LKLKTCITFGVCKWNWFLHKYNGCRFCVSILDEFEDLSVRDDVKMLQSDNCNVLDNECWAHKCIKTFNVDIVQDYLH